MGKFLFILMTENRYPSLTNAADGHSRTQADFHYVYSHRYFNAICSLLVLSIESLRAARVSYKVPLPNLILNFSLAVSEYLNRYSAVSIHLL